MVVMDEKNHDDPESNRKMNQMKETFLKSNRQKRLKNRNQDSPSETIWKGPGRPNKRQGKIESKNQKYGDENDDNFATLIEKSQKIVEKPQEGEAPVEKKTSEVDEKRSES